MQRIRCRRIEALAKKETRAYYAGTPPTIIPNSASAPGLDVHLAYGILHPSPHTTANTNTNTGTFPSPPLRTFAVALELSTFRQTLNAKLRKYGRKGRVSLAPADPGRPDWKHEARDQRRKYLAPQAEEQEQLPRVARETGGGLGVRKEKRRLKKGKGVRKEQRGLKMGKVLGERLKMMERLKSVSAVRQRSLLGWEVVREGDEERKGGLNVLEIGGGRTPENRGLEFVPWGRKVVGRDDKERYKNVEGEMWGEYLMEVGRYGGDAETDDEVLSELESEPEEEERSRRKRRKAAPPTRRVTRSMTATAKKEEELSRLQTKHRDEEEAGEKKRR